VLDFASWLREQYAQRQLANSAAARCLSDVEERELWRLVIDAGDLASDLLDPAAAARAARRARRTVYEYGIPLRALAEEPYEETQAFLDWNRRFDKRCQMLGCVSADTLLSGLSDPIGPIAWIESSVWRPVARQWLSRHGQMLRPVAAAAQSLSRFKAISPSAELAAIGDWARTNLASREGFRAWVCVPNLSRRRAEVIDALDAALAPRRFTLDTDHAIAPYAVAGGTALADYAPVLIALQSLSASAGVVRFARFSALLRAPEFQDSDAQASAAALLDVALRDRAPSEADMDGWLQIADQVAHAEAMTSVTAVQRLRAMRQAMAQLRGHQPFSAWISVWLAALDAGPWALRARWSSVEFQSAERLRELFTALATADAILGPQSHESALRVLQRAARDTPFQVQTGVPAVWVSGQLIDPWLNYDGLWVSGCSDDQWPPPVDPIALLPVRLQREYGVIAAAPESQMNLALDLQMRWQLRAAQCVFSSADSGDGRSNAPSSLLPDSATPLVTMPTPRPHWQMLRENAPLLERFSDQLAPPFSLNERTRGVATLQDQSRCAFRGFARSRLLTMRLEQPVPGFNDRERGHLVHHALEYIWSELQNSHALHALPPDAQRQLLDEASVAALAKVCRNHDPGPRWRLRERARLQSLLGKWLDVERRRAPFAVEALEQKAQVAHFAGLDFRVRIDRIDRLADDARVLIDYKSGTVQQDWRGDRPDNPQLPIYALLHPDALVAVAYGKVNAREPGFVAETERRELFKAKARSSTLEGMANFAALVAVWRTRIESLAAAFAAGHAAVAPTVKACKSCYLHGLCRVPAALEDAQDAYDR
jgi:ATP-dependent helicase/nuclease subunit B